MYPEIKKEFYQCSLDTSRDCAEIDISGFHDKGITILQYANPDAFILLIVDVAVLLTEIPMTICSKEIGSVDF